MATMSRPSKEQVREWLRRRRLQSIPPPGPDQVRRELSWGMRQGASEPVAGK